MSLRRTRNLYTFSKNNVILSVRKHNCALVLGLGLELELGLRLAKYAFGQTCFRASVVDSWTRLLASICNTSSRMKVETDRYHLLKLIFSKFFSPIFGQLPIFDWPPIPLFQNLITDILAKYFG